MGHSISFVVCPSAMIEYHSRTTQSVKLEPVSTMSFRVSAVILLLMTTILS